MGYSYVNIIQNWGEAKNDPPPCLFEGVASASLSTANISALERPVPITGVLNNGFNGDLEPGVELSEKLSLHLGAGSNEFSSVLSNSLLVVLASSSLSMLTFSLSVSTAELTSVPGTSLQHHFQNRL